jgi:hypothetical protein
MPDLTDLKKEMLALKENYLTPRHKETYSFSYGNMVLKFSIGHDNSKSDSSRLAYQMEVVDSRTQTTEYALRYYDDDQSFSLLKVSQQRVVPFDPADVHAQMADKLINRITEGLRTENNRLCQQSLPMSSGGATHASRPAAAPVDEGLPEFEKRMLFPISMEESSEESSGVMKKPAARTPSGAKFFDNRFIRFADRMIAPTDSGGVQLVCMMGVRSISPKWDDESLKAVTYLFNYMETLKHNNYNEILKHEGIETKVADFEIQLTEEGARIFDNEQSIVLDFPRSISGKYYGPRVLVLDKSAGGPDKARQAIISFVARLQEATPAPTSPRKL